MTDHWFNQYEAACQLALDEQFDAARFAYRTLQADDPPPAVQARVTNDLAVLNLMLGESRDVREQWAAALQLDPGCVAALANRSLLETGSIAVRLPNDQHPSKVPTPNGRERARVAIVSLLFNWPSTGGGTIHTVETGTFLARAGYDVRHFYAAYDGWSVGQVHRPLEHVSEAVVFDESSWNPESVRQRFHDVIARFDPDAVIVTDSWSTKPLLAEAVENYPYFLRLAALECLCPLNNVRLLFDADGHATQCPRQQLATPDVCRQCVGERDRFSGLLHRAERQLAEFARPDYPHRLYRAIAGAAAVLVVNPLIEAMVSPWAQRVEVVPSGFDPNRFPWPWPEEASSHSESDRKTLMFAGLTDEPMKGFDVLHAACQQLWQQRQDFRLWATGDPPGPRDEFTEFIGWLDQDQLPKRMRDADMLVFPTVAEEALGRSAVEAMGVGRPVIASRIGGLPFTVCDEGTGLMFEPGNVHDLADKISRLLDDAPLRERLGHAGRKRFEDHYTWNVIIERHYRRLLQPRREPHS